jgi:hypothetical protein
LASVVVSVTEQGVRNIYQPVDVVVGDEPSRPFAGWLQLLGLLSELVERQERSEAAPGGLGGEPDP